MLDNKKRNKKTKKKIRKPVGSYKENYDEYGEKKIDNLDYEKDRPPHY